MSQAFSPVKPKTASHTPPRCKRGTVLVVDDEPMLLEFLVMMLKLDGYEALSAQDGTQALEIAKTRTSGAIDLVISDLCMPDMSGLELAASWRAIMPLTKWIFTSGYPIEQMNAICRDLPEAARVSKPFGPHTIEQAIRSLLDPVPANP